LRNKINECTVSGYNKADLSYEYDTSVVGEEAYKSFGASEDCSTEDNRWPEGAGILASAVECGCNAGTKDNIWTGSRPTAYPAAPKNFGEWRYMNARATGGGVCLYIQPTAPDSPALKDALGKVTRYLVSTEYEYSAVSPNQRLVIWLQRPTGTADAACQAQ
jgi:hypothetical protein